MPNTSAFIAKPKPSVHALVISPLRSLMNDQFDRLIKLTQHLERPVERRHGDVSVQSGMPEVIVMTTPENLDARLIKHSQQVRKLFGELH